MTRLLVLGILDVQPIKKMEHEGYVAVTSIEQTGHRQKAVYSITDTGQIYLQALIKDSLKASSVLYPSTLYSGLSFYEKLSAEECRKALEEQRIALNNEYSAVKIKQQQNFVDKVLTLLENEY